MAGLGELLGTLLGGQKAGGDEANNSGILARVAVAVGDALAKIPGSPFQMVDWGAKSNAIIKNRESVIKALSEGDTATALKASGVLSKDATQATVDAVKAVADGLAGKTAKAQLEALIGAPIPASATTTNAVMDQLALLTQANEAIQALSVASEVASLGQIDRIGSELRSYLDYSGVSQISGFGYGQILGTVIGTRMNQEMLAVTRPAIPSVLDLCTMKTRGFIDDSVFMGYMAKLGYPDDVSQSLFATSSYYPGPQEWIRFAVRDVFNPDVVASAGLDEQFPDDIVPYAEKGGVSEEFMKMHWRAHWNLPSPTQAFEMLHRGLISMDQLKSILKASDYAPGYIDAMVGIAYSPYTRVDARRMYDLGILDDDGFIQAMKDIGYDDEHAANLLRFAHSDGREAEKDLSQAQMLRAYALGKVARNDLMAYLMKLGYDETESSLLIDLEDDKKADDLLNERIAVLDWKYERGDISDGQYLDTLSSEGIPRAKAEYYLTKASFEAEKSVKLPTKADVEKWYKKNYISDRQATTYLRQMRYREAEIRLYMHEWAEEAQASGEESKA